MRAFLSVVAFVLLSAVAAQAVNTTVTLSEKSWVPSQQTLIGHVGPLDEHMASVSDQAFDASDPSDEGSLPMLYVYPDLSSFSLIDPAASLAAGSSDKAGQPVMKLIDDIGNSTDPTGESGWSADPNEYAHVVNAGGHTNLPAFAEIDWRTATLPTAKEVSVMEIAVFPTLAVLVVVLIVVALIARVRKRRPVDRAQQLLRI